MNTSVILIADDDPDAILCLKHAFHRAGVACPILSLENGEAVISYLDGRKPFDDRRSFPLPTLLLMDLNMPYRSGLEVLKWIKEDARFIALPVVILTGSENPKDKRACENAGATEFLVVPQSFDGL